MNSLWNDVDAARQPALDGLLYVSRLVGADQDLVVWGGGNTSAKLEETDFRGRRVPVLRVKGSGSDLRTIRAADFPGVRLDDALPLRERDAVSDEEMVAYLAHTLTETRSPRPSIETLLHAFLPARYVVHTHADAILALTNTPHGERWVREALGPGALCIPYRRPGFALSKRVAEAYDAHASARCIVLEKHGLITWGDTAREAYERTIETVNAAEAFVARTSPPAPLPRGEGRVVPPPTRAEQGPQVGRATAIIAGALEAASSHILSSTEGDSSEMRRGKSHQHSPLPAGEGKGVRLPPADRLAVYRALAPVLRGLAARTTPNGAVLPSPAPGRPLELDPRARLVLRFDEGEDVLAFASDPQAATLSQIGPATPDHLIATRRTALYVPSPMPAFPQSGATSPRHPERSEGPAASTTVGSQLEASSGVALGWQALVDRLIAALEPAWREWVTHYVEYVRVGSPNTPAPAPEQVDVRPRVVLLPGVGMVTLGRDAKAARQAADVYRHAVRTIRGAQAVEAYASLSAQDCFDVEFWPLELYKLTLAPPEAELSRRVALVTGAGSGIGRAIAERFAAEGAHVCVADLNAASAEAVADALSERHGQGRIIAVQANVADEGEVAAVFARTVEAFGGLDIVVSNAGIAPFSAIDEMTLDDWQRAVDVNATGNFLVVREAMRLFKRQAIGGNVICVATKNVMAPGKEFGAYSASKAAQAQLARVAALEGGDYGVRVNMINPDAVFRGSTLWSPELRRARAQAHGVEEEQLGDFYRQRCLLGVPIYPEDVAEAAWWLATDRTSKMTGGVITVDGGVAAAFPR